MLKNDCSIYYVRKHITETFLGSKARLKKRRGNEVWCNT